MKIKLLKGRMAVICTVLCILFKGYSFASEESAVSEELYNQMIREQMEQVLETVQDDLESVKVEPLSGMMCITDTANVRSGPDTAYESLGMIEKDTNIMISGITENNWYQTSYQGEVAYILADYLKPAVIEEGLSQEMAEQIEDVVEAVGVDLEKMRVEESMQALEVLETEPHNENVMEKGSTNFTYIILGVLIVSGGSFFVLTVTGKKSQDDLGKELDAEKKFDITGMEMVSLDEEEQ